MIKERCFLDLLEEEKKAVAEYNSLIDNLGFITRHYTELSKEHPEMKEYCDRELNDRLSKYKKVVYGCYSSEADATFIMSDIIEKKTNRCISTEVTGFYYGEPEFEYTEKYQNTRKAEF